MADLDEYPTDVSLTALAALDRAREQIDLNGTIPISRETADLIRDAITLRDDRITLLCGMLRQISADRPSAHSDRVWEQLVAVLAMPPVHEGMPS